jgi:dTDP-glucose 4,6-dehydratase
METTLITGGAGFLGSHLCEHFLNKGHRVISLDNLRTSHPDNLAPFFEEDRFRFIEYDVTEYIYVKEELDNILHFASPASPRDYTRYPIHTLKVGSLGTHNALGLAKEKDARFLLASTSEVYGDPEEHPQKETYNGNVDPLGPRGVYDESKRFAEAMTMAYRNEHGLDTRIVRIFNTYGPRMRIDDGRVLPNFFSQALQGRDLTIYGDGTQTRSFCYVSDLIRGIDALLNSDLYQPVNLGNDHELTINQLAEKVLKITGSESGTCYEPLPEDDPKVRCPDLTRARKKLNWEPEIALEDGLKRIQEYFRQEMDLP